jgi:hypothetical protein
VLFRKLVVAQLIKFLTPSVKHTGLLTLFYQLSLGKQEALHFGPYSRNIFLIDTDVYSDYPNSLLLPAFPTEILYAFYVSTYGHIFGVQT